MAPVLVVELRLGFCVHFLDHRRASAYLVGVTPKALPDVLSVREARVSLSRLLARFRERGLDAEPVFVGSHRRADAVLLSMALFEELAPVIEDIMASQEIRRRLAADTGTRVSHEELLAELGIDPAKLR